MDEFTARALLGVSASDGPEAIHRAFRRQALRHHPDRGGSASDFTRLQEAQRTAIESAPVATRSHGGSDRWLTATGATLAPARPAQPVRRDRPRRRRPGPADDRVRRQPSFGEVLARHLSAA